MPEPNRGEKGSGATYQGVLGVFQICDTFGFPLEIAILEIRDRGYVVAWDEFIKDARKHGWKEKTIRTKILGAVNEAFGADYLTEFTKRLDKCLGNS